MGLVLQRKEWGWSSRGKSYRNHDLQMKDIGNQENITSSVSLKCALSQKCLLIKRKEEEGKTKGFSVRQ